MSFRSFLDKVFQKQEAGFDASADWREKRRSNRVYVTAQDHLKVHLLKPGTHETGKTIVASVSNVSLRGCSLIFENAADLTGIAVGQKMIASLDIEDFAIPLNVEVVRVIENVGVAVQYKAPFPKELEKLEKFLEPRCIGMSMREINPEALQQKSAEGYRWFQGVNDTHLFCWKDPATEKITQLQLIFLGNVVEWRDGAPVKTGKVQQEEIGAQGRVEWVKAELLSFDAVAAKNLLSQAEVLMNSAGIDKKVKEFFLNKLKESV